MAQRPAIFLDRDGVLNLDTGYVYRPQDLKLLEGVGETLVALKNKGYLLVVVSNQSGVARGYFSTSDVEAFHAAMQQQLERNYGVRLDRFEYCPYHPEGTVAAFAQESARRKPAPGMIFDAAQALAIDLTRSYLVGDKDSDIEAGIAAGVRSIHILKDGEPPHSQAYARAASLRLAYPYIS